MTDLDFITDADLKKTLEDSIEYLYVLFADSKNGKNALFAEETHRVIILYIVSIIEAILLYIFKKKDNEIIKIEYKHIVSLPSEYTYVGKKDSIVVVAIQKKTKKQDYEIGLSELVQFFREKKILIDETAEKILEINNIRNTFHFNKSRSSISCDIKHVEAASDLLVYVIENAPRALKSKNKNQ